MINHESKLCLDQNEGLVFVFSNAILRSAIIFFGAKRMLGEAMGSVKLEKAVRKRLGRWNLFELMWKT